MKRFKTIFLEEAVEFLDSLSEQVRDKIFYNIRKVEGGIMSSDLFKKLENTDIWDGGSHTRDSEESMEGADQRDCKG